MATFVLNNGGDLDDDLPEGFGGGDFVDRFVNSPYVPRAAAPRPAPAQAEYVETCTKCRGSGRFYGYTGRYVGPCRECDGKGSRTFKTPPEEREANRQRAAERKARVEREAAGKAAAWRERNPVEAAWMAEAAARGFEFAQSLSAALDKYGFLTERQEAAVRNAAAKSAAKRAEREAERAKAQAEAKPVDVARIAIAIAAAQASGIKRPILRLDTFKFKLASAAGRNAGAIYVTEARGGEEDTYLGKIMGGVFTRSRDCDAETEARIIAVCADPAAAAVAYGRRTGSCACCGRELTNAESIALGIGPICAGKFGFA